MDKKLQEQAALDRLQNTNATELAGESLTTASFLRTLADKIEKYGLVELPTIYMHRVLEADPDILVEHVEKNGYIPRRSSGQYIVFVSFKIDQEKYRQGGL